MDGSKAADDLIREYFDRYVPASLRDAMWWSGLYMYDDRHDEFRDDISQPQVLTLNFLAHEDVALKAYFESRARYLGRLPPGRPFNPIGEVLPTIMHGGQIVGTWAWDASKMTVTCSIIHGYGSRGPGKEVVRQAKALSETLRLVGRRHRSVPLNRLIMRRPESDKSASISRLRGIIRGRRPNQASIGRIMLRQCLG